MKLMVVGQWMWPWYQEACAEALRSLGCTIEKFSWLDDFHQRVPDRVEPVYLSRWAAVQNRLLAGPTVSRLNRRLLQAAERSLPDVIWLYNSTHILPRTVRALKARLPQIIARSVPGEIGGRFRSSKTFPEVMLSVIRPIRGDSARVVVG